MANKPKVSILCLTYNQKDYIKQTLDSFLMQKTTFEFEVLVNDDASTDGTADILREYQEKYPKIIKPIFQKQNQYSQGYRGMMTEILFPRAKGKYLALCEGDDYWTDEYKLQIQVDFMETNPDYAVCFHKVCIVYEDHKVADQIYPNVEDEDWYTAIQLMQLNYIQTNSVMYRVQDYAHIAVDVMPGDWYMHLFHARFGKIKLIDKVMSVYRKHPGGVWWDYDTNRDEIWKKYGLEHLAMWLNLRKLYANTDVKNEIGISIAINNMLRVLTGVDKKYDTKLLGASLATYPDIVPGFIDYLYDESVANEQKTNILTKELLKVGDERNALESRVAVMSVDLDKVKYDLKTVINSRAWRLKMKADRVRKMIKRQTP